MGGPNASKAMRTISMARTTPAQNPRGFNNSNCLLSDNAIPLKLGYCSPKKYALKDTFMVPEGLPEGQCKPLRVQGLAPDGEK